MLHQPFSLPVNASSSSRNIEERKAARDANGVVTLGSLVA